MIMRHCKDDQCFGSHEVYCLTCEKSKGNVGLEGSSNAVMWVCSRFKSPSCQSVSARLPKSHHHTMQQDSRLFPLIAASPEISRHTVYIIISSDSSTTLNISVWLCIYLVCVFRYYCDKHAAPTHEMNTDGESPLPVICPWRFLSPRLNLLCVHRWFCSCQTVC